MESFECQGAGVGAATGSATAAVAAVSPMTGNAPATTVSRRRKAASRSIRTSRDDGIVDRRLALVLPAQPDPRAAIDRLEIGGGRDRPEARDRQSPPDVVVGLPVHDLLERREPPGHALGDRADAAPATRRGLVDADRSFPARPKGRRRQVGPHDGRLGVDGRDEVEQGVAMTEVQPAHAALDLPACLEVERERGDATQVLDRLLRGRQAKLRRVEAQGVDRRFGEEREPLAAGRDGPGALEQPVDEDDIGSGQLVAPGDRTPDVGAVVHEQLEVESRGQPARVAVAARGLVDAPQPPPEGEIGGFDGVEQQRAVRTAVLDEEEGRVALELGEAEGRIEPADDGLEEVAGDRGRMLELALRHVRRVPGEVRDDEEAGLGCRCHGQTLDLGAAPMSIPLSRVGAGGPDAGARP